MPTLRSLNRLNGMLLNLCCFSRPGEGLGGGDRLKCYLTKAVGGDAAHTDTPQWSYSEPKYVTHCSPCSES